MPGEVTRRMLEMLPGGGDSALRGVVVGPEVHAADPSGAGRQKRWNGDPAVLAENRLRCFDHQLQPDRTGVEAECALECVAGTNDGGDVTGAEDLGKRDHERARERAAALPYYGRNEQIERAKTARIARTGHRLDPDADERRQGATVQRAGQFTR